MSLDVERVILAAGLASKPARDKLRGIITGSDFEHPVHEVIWDAIVRLEKSSTDVASFMTVSEAVRGHRGATEVMPDLARIYSVTEAVTAAHIVRDRSIKRQARNLITRWSQVIEQTEAAPAGILSTIVNEATALRESSVPDDQITAVTLRELLDKPDEPYQWLIPGLIERGDRFMLTGVEGQGKSVLLRQIAVAFAAGVHPFRTSFPHIAPGKVLIVDAENSERQVRRSMRGLAQAVANKGQRDPRDFVMVECTGRIDITNDLVLSRIHHTLDAQQPDVVVIGPLYRITSGALMTDDDAAPVLAALDTIKDRGISLLIEAHAGHAQKVQGVRDMRPRGSSALLGWPEFGYGLRPDPDRENGYRLERWRGDRDVRDWPTTLDRGGWFPWRMGEEEAVEWETRGSPWTRSAAG